MYLYYQCITHHRTSRSKYVIKEKLPFNGILVTVKKKKEKLRRVDEYFKKKKNKGKNYPWSLPFMFYE